MELTIAIPTYKRNELLLQTVRDLLPQMVSGCRLLILDNHSPVPVEETLRAGLSEYPIPNCTVVRNVVNIGGCANVIRCFELCVTPWLWVLGDDDHVLPDAVNTVLDVITTDPDLTYINFAPGAVGDGRAASFVTRGQEEFVEKLDRFMHSNFISACIYNVARVQPRLHHAHLYAYSFAPHTAMLLMSLGADRRALFSDKKIVKWELPPLEQQPSNHAIWLGFMTLLELQMPARVRRLLARAMMRERPALRGISRELYYAATQSGGDFDTSRYRYDQLAFRLFYFDRSLGMRLKIWIYRLPLSFPRSFAFLNALSARALGRRIEPFVPSQRME